jgi:hypothetical protein
MQKRQRQHCWRDPRHLVAFKEKGSLLVQDNLLHALIQPVADLIKVSKDTLKANMEILMTRQGRKKE